MLVTGTEARDRRVVGDAVCADDANGDVFYAAALDLARRALADRVGVEQERDHHPRVEGGAAPAVRAIGRVERPEFHRGDGVEHVPGEVVPGAERRFDL